MADSLAGLVLAAGAGTRLAPLTSRAPKALCPVGDRPMLDHALDRMVPVVGEVAVNLHDRAAEVIEHLDRCRYAVHLSVERPEALGTAGAVGNLSGWLDGRSVLVANADTWHLSTLHEFVQQWDRERVAVLTATQGAFGPTSSVVASLIPAAVASGLSPEPSGLWEALWREHVATGRLQTVNTDARALDCGTPARYLDANLCWLEEQGLGEHRVGSAAGSWVHPDAEVTGPVEGSVVGRGATVAGRLRRCVVWPATVVTETEDLSDTIRAWDLTVAVR